MLLANYVFYLVDLFFRVNNAVEINEKELVDLHVIGIIDFKVGPAELYAPHFFGDLVNELLDAV